MKTRKISGSILSFALAASMVMGLSGTTTLAAEGEEEAATQQTILVKEQVKGTADTSFDYHIFEIVEADKPIGTMDDITLSVPGSGLSYIICDTDTGEEIGIGTTDEDGGFSLSAEEYAEFAVPAQTDWYVFQDTPDAYPLTGVTADGEHASVVDSTNGVVQYEDSGSAAADKSALAAEYDSDLSYSEDDYTPESWAAFKDAMEHAKEVLDDEDATQEEVDKALDELEKAREGLEKKDDEPSPKPTVDVTGTKTWDDANDQDGLRPDNITVNLLANGRKLDSQTVAEGADGSWTYAFEGMPEYTYSGDEITYIVTEDEVADYTTEINGYDITNSYTPETMSLAVNKEWDDADNQDGKRPDSITIGLFADKTFVESIDVTEADDWSCTFDDLPVCDKGSEIQYVVYEEDIADYSAEGELNDDTLTITNSYTPEETSVMAAKIWDDADDQDGIRPDSVIVNLLADGQPALDENNGPITAELTEQNNWRYDFTGLPKYADGQEIAYTVTEDEVAGYEAEDPFQIDGTNTFILMNTHEPALYNGDGNLTVTKTWDDEDDRDGLRPDYIRFTVKADGEAVRQEYVTEAEDWACTFTGLPRCENGQEIEYTVEETLPPSVPEGAYTTDITQADGAFTVTNTHEPDTVTVTVNKVWVDNENEDGTRPDFVTIHLWDKDTGTHLGSAALNEENGWQFTFGPQPKYENGKEINYEVTEEAAAGYDTDIAESEDADGCTVFTITNTYDFADTIDITGTKVWDDDDDRDGIRPDEVTIELLADGEVVASQDVTPQTSLAFVSSSPITGFLSAGETNEWNFIFKDLPKYNENGSKIEYSIDETPVEGYTMAGPVTVEPAEDGYKATITNTHEPARVTVGGAKAWNDGDDRDSIRPDDITVNLLANGKQTDSVTVSADENGVWMYRFSDLPQNDESGHEITYTVSETTPAGYASTCTGDADAGFTITNTALLNSGDDDPDNDGRICVTKAWNDSEGDHDAIDSVTILLPYSYVDENGDTVSEQKELALTAEGGWTGAFTGLPAFSECGTAITYEAVKEKEDADLAAYTATVTGDAAGGYIVTNTLMSVGVSVTPEETDTTYDGAPVTLTAEAEASLSGATYTYQWYKDGAAIDGATDAVLTLAGNVSDSGTYKCVVTAAYGLQTVTAEGEAAVTIGRAAQTIVFENESLTKAVGETFTNETTSDSVIDGALTYTSSDPGVAVVGETTGEVTVVGVGSAQIIVTAAETDNYNSATAVYTVEANDEGLSAEVSSDLEGNKKTYDGAEVTLTAEADSSVQGTTYTYRWYKESDAGGDEPASEETEENTLTLAGNVSDSGTYRCEITVLYPNGETATIEASIAITIGKAPQSISYEQETVEKVYGDGPFVNPLTVTKVSTESGAGITYASSSANVAVAGADGEVTIMGAGSATITATAAGTANYEEASAAYTVNVTVSATIVLTLTDSRTGEPISGAKFELYKDDELYKDGLTTLAAKDVRTLATDEAGTITVSGLPAGEYFFKQTAAAEGYIIPDPDTTETVTFGTDVRKDDAPFEVSFTNHSFTVDYAVKIWGIQTDTYSYNEGTDTGIAGLTFGPATGADHLKNGTAHLSEQEYEAGSGVCIHWMTWEEIIAQSEADPKAFEECQEYGCTKTVELTPNATLFNTYAVSNAAAQAYTGDGVSTLYNLLNGASANPYNYTCWNDNSTGATETARDTANVYSRSRIRATLTGDGEDAKERVNGGYNDFYGVVTLCDEDDCLFSCFPSELQDAVVPRETLNTGNATYSPGINVNDKTTYDKLFLFSPAETGITDSMDDGGGGDYGVNSSSASRIAYEFSGADAAASGAQSWWSRSRYFVNGSYAIYISNGNSAYNIVSANNGLSPGFCIR